MIRLSTFCCYSCVHRNTFGECECKNGQYVAERDFTCEDYMGKICGDCCFFEGNIDIDNEFKNFFQKNDGYCHVFEVIVNLENNICTRFKVNAS